MTNEDLDAIGDRLSDPDYASELVSDCDSLLAEVRWLRDGIHNINGWLVHEADAENKVDADTLLLMLGTVLDGS